MSQDSPIDAKFWRVLSRALGRSVAPGRYSVADLPEWDSLRHVELVGHGVVARGNGAAQGAAQDAPELGVDREIGRAHV